MQTPPRYIVIHDTDISISYQAQQLQNVNGYHRKNGYDESAYGYWVCYHVFIGTTGKIVQTRPLTDRVKCTSNNDANMEAIHVVVAGAFEEERPRPAQIRSLLSVVNRLQRKYNIPDKSVVGHKEASPTTCPGRYMMDVINKHF